ELDGRVADHRGAAHGGAEGVVVGDGDHTVGDDGRAVVGVIAIQPEGARAYLDDAAVGDHRRDPQVGAVGYLGILWHRDRERRVAVEVERAPLDVRVEVVRRDLGGDLPGDDQVAAGADEDVGPRQVQAAERLLESVDVEGRTLGDVSAGGVGELLTGL